MSDDDRRLFAMPALSGQLDGIELGFLDPDDEHDRSELILAEHPDLRSAIESGREQIHHHGRAVNPALHLAMHEIVANQLLANEPPEMWGTAKRLMDAGYDRHEVLHMLASVVSDDVYSALHDNQPPDTGRVVNRACGDGCHSSMRCRYEQLLRGALAVFSLAHFCGSDPLICARERACAGAPDRAFCAVGTE